MQDVYVLNNALYVNTWKDHTVIMQLTTLSAIKFYEL